MAKVTIKQGTCSWTDPTLISCGRFYPKGCTKAADRLAYYAKQFPCVEVDTSSYAIPQKKSHEEWIKVTPKDFIFHFKAYGLTTLISVQTQSLPWQVKEKLPDIVKLKDSVSQTDLTDDIVDEVFRVQNEALAKFHDAGKLGVVLFQFQANVRCDADSWRYVERCRRLLDARFTMAVEFRSLSWFSPQTNLDDTLQRCRAAGIVLVGVDELITGERNKTVPKTLAVVNDTLSERDVGLSLPPKKLFVATQTTNDKVFVRVHRREGDERRLSDDELAQWSTALQSVASRAKTDTTIYMMWNTNYEDHSMVNAAKLSTLFDESPITVLDWKSKMREQEMQSKTSILGFFGRSPAKKTDGDDNASSSTASTTSSTKRTAANGAASSSTATASTSSPAKKAKVNTDAKQPNVASFFSPKKAKK